MPDTTEQIQEKRLLVFNCHEAWVHQLELLGYGLDIIVGLKGRMIQTWDARMRPMPSSSRLISLEEAQHSPCSYYCIITHNIADLLDVRDRQDPKLLVIHSTIEGRQLEEGTDVAPAAMRSMLNKYLRLVGGHAVAVSKLKGQSWGVTDDIVPFSADPTAYPPYKGDVASGLRICNFINSRKQILLWDFHSKAFQGLPVRLVGHNPDIPAVRAAQSWDELKTMLQSHRFYIHTAHPELEDGYNMATLEAMAAGIPIIGNTHPSSPIDHGVSGFLCDNPVELRRFAQMLLEDRNLAAKMGKEARKTVCERFGPERFSRGIRQSIETARRKICQRTAFASPKWAEQKERLPGARIK